MTIIRLVLPAVALLLAALPVSAQSDRRSPNTSRPTSALSLTSPEYSPSGTFIRCRVTDVAMSDEGLGFTCITGDNKPYLVVTTGGNPSGGISANLSLVMKMLEQPTYYRRLRVKQATGAALRVCGLLRGGSAGSDGLTCVQAMSIRFSSTDNPVKTGNANPNGPNIPTGSASPD